VLLSDAAGGVASTTSDGFLSSGTTGGSVFGFSGSSGLAGFELAATFGGSFRAGVGLVRGRMGAGDGTAVSAPVLATSFPPGAMNAAQPQYNIPRMINPMNAPRNIAPVADGEDCGGADTAERRESSFATFGPSGYLNFPRAFFLRSCGNFSAMAGKK
jgi:hypothetical protein